MLMYGGLNQWKIRMISVLTLNACRYLWQWIHIVWGRLSSNAFPGQKVAGENSSSSYRGLENGVQGLSQVSGRQGAGVPWSMKARDRDKGSWHPGGAWICSWHCLLWHRPVMQNNQKAPRSPSLLLAINWHSPLLQLMSTTFHER